jgi:phosphate transport system permease protein
MILPTVINVSESSLRAVPAEYRDASFGVGATHIQTIFKVLIPTAKSGILTSIVLGIGRAIGEAMAIILVAGNVANFPLPFNSVKFLTTGIVSDMNYASGVHREALFGMGLVLFVFVMVVNIILNLLLKNGGERVDK